MEDNQTEKRGHPALVTFILVLIILFLSGVLVYLRYGDLILNRVYQFTDGKLGVETGVTSLPGRDTRTPVEDTDTDSAAAPDETARAADPPSRAAIRFSRTSWVEFVSLPYIFPASASPKRSAACLLL